jgi:cytochrome c
MASDMRILPWSMTPEKHALGHDPRVEAGLPPSRSPLRRAKEVRKRSCSNKSIERDTDSNRNRALAFHYISRSPARTKSLTSRRPKAICWRAQETVMRELAVVALMVVVLGGPSAAQDVAAGETSFKKCLPCHAIGPGATNKVGPLLNGLDGRKSGTAADYSYSDANKNSGITWNEEAFEAYIKDPRGKIPGTKMIFPGIRMKKKPRVFGPISSSSTPTARSRRRNISLHQRQALSPRFSASELSVPAGLIRSEPLRDKAEMRQWPPLRAEHTTQNILSSAFSCRCAGGRDFASLRPE